MVCSNCGCSGHCICVPFSFKAKLSAGSDAGLLGVGLRLNGSACPHRISVAGEVTIAAIDANGPMFKVFPFSHAFAPSELERLLNGGPQHYRRAA